MKGEEGEVVVLEGGDGVGDEDAYGDELMEKGPPPLKKRLFYPSQSGRKRPWEKTRGSSEQRPLSSNVPKSWSTLWATPPHILLPPQGTRHLLVGHPQTFSLIN